MLRRTVAALEKLVIVESPNKVIKVEGLLSDPRVIPDWSFSQEHLKKLGKGAEKAVAMATTGHFMALKEIRWTPRGLSVLDAAGDDKEIFPPNGMLANYTLEWQLLPGRRIQETLERYMQEKLNNLTEIILATDPDREGELIAVHALQTIRRLQPKLKVPFSRAYMHSITEDGIRKAMRERNVDKCDYDLANAAETRHAMDRIFGFLGSSVVRAANSQMRSIGRVQTPALILIHEREERIASFLEKNKPTYFVQAMCQFPASYGTTFSQVVTVHSEGKDGASQWGTQAEAAQCMQRWNLSKCSGFSVPYEPVITTSVVSQPLPLTMASAIAKANRQLKMTSEAVSGCLQDLFQLGHITYPRTDSTRIDESVLPAIYDVIKRDFGKEYLCSLEKREAATSEKKKSKKVGKKKRGKQETVSELPVGNVEDAHEAIRPTNIQVDGDSLPLSQQTKAVYELVRKTTLAAFMIPMKAEKITATVRFVCGSGECLRVVLGGKRVAEPGWTRAFNKSGGAFSTGDVVLEDEGEAENEGGPSAVCSLSQEEFTAITKLRNTLSTLRQSHLFELRSPTVLENRPAPPLAHSEGTLIEELKNNGVGRPSTYPMIVKTLLTRGYIQVNSKGRCETTAVGRLLVSTAKSTFPSIVDIGFTASFEKQLDTIAKPDSTKRLLILKTTKMSQADYVLSLFLSSFLNYVAEATHAHRAGIVERSMRLKYEQTDVALRNEVEFEESVANAKKKMAFAAGDLVALPKTLRTFTALQRGLNEYLRHHFPSSKVGFVSSSTGSSATINNTG